MKYINKTVMLIALMLIITIPTTMVSADNKAASYSIKTVKETLKNDKGDIIAVISYEQPALKGNNQAITKINQSIKNDCTKTFKQYKDNLFEYAKIASNAGDLQGSKYYCTTKCEVTYNGKATISFKMTMSWYAGGVSNKSSYGLTYNVKTGKKLALTNVVKGSSTEIKNKVMNSAKKYLNGLKGTSKEDINNALNVVKKYKVSDFKYYLKGEKAYICFDEYELIGNYYGGNIFSINMK
ncbi:PdaC/SigV domain-containing protein [Anaeromicropila herbilytica]|uniref:Deacetylase PdaC domain-containing protein n=1 Tax=Anaeromicropila herbilytica TaxID=2785025 RepID=A0A7R7ENL6_9FIRM|nr:DUF4163 domain-containing protein [Anaeromicropila herbilytica]BCN31802.1 hypothetical protein bsdtb5_30970 [Anaeromicropila herbilytica]